ncbi:DNA-directed RNA polymerase III subunit RPC7-like isoform X2 [Stegodyphus dumicola]|uniref:DNA-directed RNA polymerase III subunit RPC7-like isoform X2 n=1 Tax=Stegodyphus dumicola TaxID=202533 RepID=UPI0015AF5B6C|nr:DNA-directed RNA polymerase III subunit RPC7-like isoform X2 [Stegodyphus dumicola]
MHYVQNLYPLQFKPLPLVTGKKILYTLTLKQEIRTSFKESGYSIPPVTVKKDIERYTDKYQPVHAADQIVWDKAFFPTELFDEPKKKKRKVVKKQTKAEAVVEKLKLLEAKEETEEEEEEKEEEAENEEEYDEEELEEGTDYAANYFDNGESYLEEDDDNVDEGYDY